MRPLNILYILLPLFTVTGALRVTMRTSVVSVLRDEDVAIHCDVSGLNPGSAIAVLWRRTSENGTEYDVYNYIDEKETSYRPGSYIEPKEVRKGNAELHLPRVQISDEGVYTCTVINTPNSAEGRATLQVSAAPLVYVTPEKPTIELGTEKTVMCKVYNFYPKNIFMQWVQCHKSSSKRKVLKIWKKFHENSDGTYNETSLLTLNPKMEDNENIYSCIINHRSLQTELSRNVTLIVTEREDNTGDVITAVIITILCTLFLGLLGFLYIRFIKKDPKSLEVSKTKAR